MSNFDVSVTARFRNQMGTGAKSAERDLAGVAQAARAIGRVDLGNRLWSHLRSVSEASVAVAARLEKIGQNAAAVATGWAAMRKILVLPATTDADLTDVMIDVAQKANLAKGEVEGLTDEVKALATRLSSSPVSVGKGVDVLLGADSSMSIDTAMRLIEPIQKVAKAYRVETEQVSAAVFSMKDKLDIGADQMILALARLAQASTDGRFEIRHFATEIPNLAQTLNGLGQTGLKGVSRIAAAAEVVSGAVGGDASAAGTALSDMLEKLTSPDVQRNFKAKGVDITKLVDNATKNGSDIFETVYAALMKATKGKTSRVVDIFGDKEARRAAVALMQGIDAYREMRDRYNKIERPDKLNADLEMRLGGAGATYRTAGERFEAFFAALGKGVNAYAGPVVKWLTELLDLGTRLAEMNKWLTGGATIGASAGAGWVGYLTAKGILSRFGVGAAGGAAAGAAGTAAAAAPAVGGSVAPGAMEATFVRLASAPSIAGGAFLGLAWLGAMALKFGLNPPAWTVKDRADGEAQLRDLEERRAELQRTIEGFTANSKAPDVAEMMAAPARTMLADVENKIRVLQEEMRKLDAVTVTPKIDTGPIERALEMMRLLNGAARGGGAATSFKDNAAPAGRARSDGTSGRQSVVTTHNNFNVTGYSPAVVARRIAREEQRAVREVQYGALHDLGSLA